MILFNPRIVSSAAVITITCVVSAAAYYYKTRCKEVNEVMVFCKLQYNAYSCFDKLISYVEAAKKSISICMPSIQNPAIHGRLVDVVLQKKIKLHIIIDKNGYNETTDFFLKELLNIGAEIKCKANGTYNMQHKFCLVDDRILMTGTLNWGNDRSSEHWNYVYITSKPQLVEPVRKEFNEMWTNYINLQEALQSQTDLYDTEDEDTAEITSEPETRDEINTQTVESLSLNIKENRLTPELNIV